MPIHLLIAIFDYASLSERALQGAINARPQFGQALSTITVFDRTSDNTVMARVIKVSEDGHIVDLNRKGLSEDLLKELVPRRADWTVLSSAFGDEIPRTALNGEFCGFLEIMMLHQTSSVFFVPHDDESAVYFLDAMRADASVLLHTTMTQDELQTLRASLAGSRKRASAAA